MTGVYTDQKSSNVGGELTRNGATGGVANLVALSQSPSRPCVFDPTGNLTPFVEAVAATTCTPVGSPTFTLFDSWASLPNNPGHTDQLSVARGQAVFNSVGCTACHTVNNLGNNASAISGVPFAQNGFKRDGTESPSIMQVVLADASTPQEAAMVQDMIDRNNELPLYCLRPTNSTATGTCGTDSKDVVTTDPGRALVSGKIADAGLFKPPILRNLAVRAPFFHAGAAADSKNGTAMQHLVNFYNLRFHFGLNAQDQADLVNFLNAL
jgi:cytochrome c peroxidase